MSTEPLASAPAIGRFARTTISVASGPGGQDIPSPSHDQAEVIALVTAPDQRAQESAWEALLARYSRLIFRVSQSFGGGHDATMDRYAFVLERMQEDGHRRLRAFQLDGPARFTTWLVVVTRRLCLDQHRQVHGRAPSANSDATVARAVRWRLAHDHGEGVDLETIPDDQQEASDETLIRSDRTQALRSALAELSARDRLLLYLRYEQGLSASRIATATGLPSAFHVYRRLRTVTGRLRATLEAGGIDGGEA